jgi:hypothetical protein
VRPRFCSSRARSRIVRLAAVSERNQLAQALVSNPAVEAFDEGVLYPSPGPDEAESHSSLVRPGI